MTLPLLTAALLIAVASTTSPDAGSETGVLAYRILGPEGAPVPARLTVLVL